MAELTTPGFSERNGNLYFGSRKIVDFITPSIALITLNGRSFFTSGDHHIYLDKYISAKHIEGVRFTYVQSFAEYRNPTSRVAEFVSDAEAAKLMNSGFGFGFSNDEIDKFLSTYSDIIGKIKTTFEPVKTDYPFVAPIDIDQVFGSEAKFAREYLEGKSNRNSQFDRIFKTMRDDMINKRLLRVKTSDKGIVRVDSSIGSEYRRGYGSDSGSYHMTVDRFKKVFDVATAFWTKSPKGRQQQQADFNERHYAVIVHPNHIAIGCQSFPRSEVERIGLQLDFEFPKGVVEVDYEA